VPALYRARRAASHNRVVTSGAAANDSASGATSKRRPRWLRLLIWVIGILVAGALADLLGWNIHGWFKSLWDSMTGISAGYLAAGVVAITIQTVATAYAWYSILRFAFPGRTRWRDILTAYSVSVALNAVLPANIGTLVMLIMFTVLIAGTTFAGILGAYAVEKIFFTVAGAFVYLYLFLTVGGSFDIKFSFVHDRPVATVVLIGGTIIVLVLLARRFWPKIVEWWQSAKEGGAILARPGAYLGRVFLPSFIGWLAMLGAMAVFLAAYGIPVTFEVLMRVAGGNSIANVTSVTPGGAGVTQAFNVASLTGITDSATATAYSVTQQLVTTAWNILFAILLMIWAWGWSGGKELVQQSYADAKRRQEEEMEKRRQRKAARAAEHGQTTG
jgi:uncharacterized membrane protein YbhN (UPF0104 family)